MSEDKLGIILGNTGTPASPKPDDVEAYLQKFLMDPHVRPMPKILWSALLHFKILPKRKFSSAAKYESIWTSEGSPLIFHQRKLAARLQQRLEEMAQKGTVPANIMVRSAMSYSEPSFHMVLQEMKEHDIGRIILIPLYPQSNFSSTNAVVDAFRHALKQMKWDPEIAIVNHYADQKAYIKAIAQSIRDAGFDPASNDRLVMSFHSIPQKDVRNGDTYPEQTEATHVAVAKELGMRPEQIAYGMQCVFGGHPERWVGPLTRDILSTWSHQDFGRVFIVLPGFAVDCLETIYDVNQDFVPLFRRLSDGKVLHEVIRVPCLNESDAHVNVLCAVLKPYIQW